MITDWQIESPYSAGVKAGFDGANEEFDNPYWQSGGQEEQDWLQGFAHGSQSNEFRKLCHEDAEKQ